MTSETLQVHVFRQGSVSHVQFRQPGVPGQRHNPMACGVPASEVLPAAWFKVGDPRAWKLYGRLDDDCSAALEY